MLFDQSQPVILIKWLEWIDWPEFVHKCLCVCVFNFEEGYTLAV